MLACFGDGLLRARVAQEGCMRALGSQCLRELSEWAWGVRVCCGTFVGARGGGKWARDPNTMRPPLHASRFRPPLSLVRSASASKTRCSFCAVECRPDRDPVPDAGWGARGAPSRADEARRGNGGPAFGSVSPGHGPTQYHTHLPNTVALIPYRHSSHTGPLPDG